MIGGILVLIGMITLGYAGYANQKQGNGGLQSYQQAVRQREQANQTFQRDHQRAYQQLQQQQQRARQRH